MVRNAQWLVVALGVAVAGCPTAGQFEASGRAGGAVASSIDDARLYLADEDNDELVVFDTATEKVISRIKVGRWPEKVVVGAEGLVYVSNRHARSVSVVDPVAAQEVARIEVGSEPTGLALTPDGLTLLVANTTSSTLSVVDVASRKVVRTIATEADPSGVAVMGEGKAYVTHARLGSVSVVDYQGGVVREGVSLALPQEQTFFEKRLPGQPLDPVTTADGRVFVPHIQSKEEPIPTDGQTDGYVSSAGVPVVATALVEIDPVENKIIPATVSAANGCPECDAMPGRGFGGNETFVTSFNAPVAGPVAAVADSRGDWLFIVNQLSNNVSIRSTRGGAHPDPVQVGSGPRGIALSKDGRKAWVYNAFDHTVSVLEPKDGVVKATREIVVGRSPLTPEQQLGRHLFFSATDPLMTTGTATGISCASCHPGGRDDGRTWKFSEGPRNTPTLAGRHLATTAPYHWDGLLEDMHAFKLVVEERMGGTGTKGSSDRGTVQDPLSAADFNSMMAYLDVLPSPDNPFRTDVPTPAVVRGKATFEGKAACATCHTGGDLTDNGFYDVGTMHLAELFPKKVNTPTLRNIFFSAPYLHDGSVPTLKARVTTNPGDKHGLTSQLAEAEVDDLVEYLKTL